MGCWESANVLHSAAVRIKYGKLSGIFLCKLSVLCTPTHPSTAYKTPPASSFSTSSFSTSAFSLHLCPQMHEFIFPPCFFSFQAPSYCADIVTLCFLKSCTEEEAFIFSLFYIIRLLWNSSVFPVVCGCWGQSTHSWYSKPSSRARTRSSPPPFYLPIPFILLLQICSIEGSAQTPVRAFKNDQLIQSKKSVFDSKFLDS